MNRLTGGAILGTSLGGKSAREVGNACFSRQSRAIRGIRRSLQVKGGEGGEDLPWLGQRRRRRPRIWGLERVWVTGRPKPREKPIPTIRFMGLSELPRLRMDSTMAGFPDAGVAGAAAGFSLSSANATFLVLLAALRTLSVLPSRTIPRPPIAGQGGCCQASRQSRCGSSDRDPGLLCELPPLTEPSSSGGDGLTSFRASSSVLGTHEVRSRARRVLLPFFQLAKQESIALPKSVANALEIFDRRCCGQLPRPPRPEGAIATCC